MTSSSPTITVTKRMEHSPALQLFIASERRKEVAAIHKLLNSLENSGHFDYEGNDCKLAQNGRNGAMLRVSSAINKCQFYEFEEMIAELRSLMTHRWSLVFDKLEADNRVDLSGMENLCLPDERMSKEAF